VIPEGWAAVRDAGHAAILLDIHTVRTPLPIATASDGIYNTIIIHHHQ
jgi:hypothetical protein